MFGKKKARNIKRKNQNSPAQQPAAWLSSLYNSSAPNVNDDAFDLNEIEAILSNELKEREAEEKIQRKNYRRDKKNKEDSGKNYSIDSLEWIDPNDDLEKITEMLEALMSDENEEQLEASKMKEATDNSLSNWLSENIEFVDFLNSKYSEFKRNFQKFKKLMYEKGISHDAKIEAAREILLDLDDTKNFHPEQNKDLENCEIDILKRKACCEFDLQRWENVITTLKPVVDKIEDLNITVRYARALKILNRIQEARPYIDAIKNSIADPKVAQRYTVEQLRIFNLAIQRFDKEFPDNIMQTQSDGLFVIRPVVYYNPKITPRDTLPKYIYMGGHQAGYYNSNLRETCTDARGIELNQQGRDSKSTNDNRRYNKI